MLNEEEHVVSDKCRLQLKVAKEEEVCSNSVSSCKEDAIDSLNYALFKEITLRV